MNEEAELTGASESAEAAGSAELCATEDNKTNEKNTAQRRWQILARAVGGSSENIDSKAEGGISIRRFAGFDLLKIESMKSVDPSFTWQQYSVDLNGETYSIQVRRVKKNFSANELIGFNNTGNVCVWPSEECLAYYLLKNRDICNGKRVLELGGGMTCLAGALVAKYCNPRAVTLTDGNVTSVENVKHIIVRNRLSERVECGLVKWDVTARALRSGAADRTKSKLHGSELLSGPYDVILTSDCLFFDEAHSDLVETVYGWLDRDGIAIMMAPLRGDTFEKFSNTAKKRGFFVRILKNYDDEIWSKHNKLSSDNQDYDPNLHYPILMELLKPKRSPG